MKRWGWIWLPLGIALLIVLVLRQGVGDIATLIGTAGWALCWLLPFHALPLLLDAQGWRLLLDKDRRTPLPFLWWVAAVREAVGRLLPVAGIGGEIIGVRLACRRLPDSTLVAATVIVEVLVTLGVQYVFSAAGLLLMLASISSGGAWVRTAALGLLLSVPLPAAAAILLRRGGIFHAIERWAARMPVLARLPALDGKRLDAALDALMERPGLLLRVFLWQLAGYVLGAFEIWYALDLLGHPVSALDAIAIEALTQAVRHAAFFVPGGLGVQEATLLLLAQVFGVPHDAALSLALVKRVREIVFGCLALGSWQLAEIRRGRDMARR